MEKDESETRMARLTYLDSSRGLAVFLMVCAHTAKLHHGEWEPSNLLHSFAQEILRIEPVISALFLFISGLTLAVYTDTTHSNRREALEKSNFRVALFYLTAVLLCLAEYKGVGLASLASPGILLVIALGGAITLRALLMKRSYLCLSVLTLTSVLSLTVCERLSIHVLGLTQGPSSFAPMVGFIFLGALSGAHLKKTDGHGLSYTVAGACLILSTVFYSKPWVSSHSAYPFPGLFWRHTACGFLACTAATIAIIHALRFCELKKWNRSLTLLSSWLGRHALPIYVSHLVILDLARSHLK